MWGRVFVQALLCLGLWGRAMADPAGFVEDFKSIDTEWHVADYKFSHPKFDTDWSLRQIGLDTADAAAYASPDAPADGEPDGPVLGEDPETLADRVADLYASLDPALAT